MIKILKNKKYVIILMLLIIFFLAYIINYNTIWAADDYAFYNKVWNGFETFSFSHILKTTVNFYLSWTGRFVSTFINYVFLFFSKSFFNICNSAMFTMLVYLIYKISKKEKNDDSPIFLLISFVLVWFFMPQLGEVAFWQIGSVIYLWTYVLVLVVLLLFIQLLKEQIKIKDNFLNIILLFILGLITGNGFETNSIILVCFEFLAIFYRIFIKKQKAPLWSIFLFAGCFIGFCTNLFSPGNAVRIESMGTSSSIIDTLKLGPGGLFFRGIFQTNIYILLIIAVFLYIIYLFYKNKFRNKKIFTVIFMLVFIFSIALFISCIHLFNCEISEFLSWFYNNYKKFDLFILILALNLLSIGAVIFVFRKRIFLTVDSKVNTIFLLLIVSALVGICSYIVTSLAWPRSYMGMSGFIIIAICVILRNMNLKVKHINVYYSVVVTMIILLFSISYTTALKEIIKSKNWLSKTENQIYEEIKQGNDYILVETYLSKNKYNAASIEKWVIPPIVDDTEYVTEDGIHKDYEWINIDLTKYYFNNNNAWNEGKRIIGK